MTLGFPPQRPVAPWSEHHWWGIWATPAQLPNVAGSLAQYEADVQEGDLTWVQSTMFLYVCQDPTPNAAIWVPVGGGASVDDHFAPRIIVGNTLNGDPAPAQAPPFQYLSDPGDGSGITAALASASSGFDVYIRPGVYTLPAGVHFTIPAGVRVRGAPPGANGLSGTIIIASAGDANDTQDVFTLGTASALEDIQIRVPPGANGGQAGVAIVLVPSIATLMRNVYIDMTYTGTGDRNTPVAIGSGQGAAPGTGCIYEDCEVLMPAAESTVFFYVGFFQGFPGVDSVVATGRGPVYRGCVTRGGQQGFFAFNIAAPTYENCTMDAVPSFGSGISFTIDAMAAVVVECPRIANPRIFFSTVGDAANSAAAGITISSATTDATTRELRDLVISGQQIVFDRGAGNLLGARQGIKIRVEQDGTGQVNNSVIGPGVIDGAQIAVFAQSLTTDNTAGVKGSINDLVITGVQGRGFQTYGAFVGQGASLDIQNVVQPKINRVSIVGCDFSGAAAGEDGVAIDTGVTNTIVVSNQLTPGAGTAINDLGTNSQIGENILT